MQYKRPMQVSTPGSDRFSMSYCSSSVHWKLYSWQTLLDFSEIYLSSCTSCYSWITSPGSDTPRTAQTACSTCLIITRQAFTNSLQYSYCTVVYVLSALPTYSELQMSHLFQSGLTDRVVLNSQSLSVSLHLSEHRRPP